MPREGAIIFSDLIGKLDAVRVTKNETLVRRGKKWFRYDAPDKRLFKELQKTLMVSPN